MVSQKYCIPLSWFLFQYQQLSDIISIGSSAIGLNTEKLVVCPTLVECQYLLY